MGYCLSTFTTWIPEYCLVDFCFECFALPSSYNIFCGACIVCAGAPASWCTGSCTVSNCFYYPCMENCDDNDHYISGWQYYCKGDELWRFRYFSNYSCPESTPPGQGYCTSATYPTDYLFVEDCEYGCENKLCNDCGDLDNDGYDDSSCGGNDCNDNNQNIHPGKDEVCNGIDDNCDGIIDDIDNDNDGYKHPSCGGSDCNDNNPNINPSQSENCNNGIDDDCDTAADNEDPECGGCFCTEWVNSNCGGGSCVSIQRQQTRTCTPSGCNREQTCIVDTNCGSNCDDTSYTSCGTAYSLVDSGAGPGVIIEEIEGMCGEQQFYKVTLLETCDIHWEIVEGNLGVGVDYDLYTEWDADSCSPPGNWDCKQLTDQKNEVCEQTSLPPGTYYAMVDKYSGSGYYDIAVMISNCVGPCEPSEETCNNQDDNCNGQVDENLVSQCGTTNIGECKYGTQTCSAGNWGSCIGNTEPTAEICDSKDNDCDSQIDEELTAPNCAIQQGVCAGSKKICGGSSGWLDCSGYDYGSDYQTEEISCDSKDNDCDGLVDENVARKIYKDNDEDNHGNETNFYFACSAVSGFSTYHFDCDDNDNHTYVGAVEICDGKDNDCDGLIDEGCFLLKEGWNLISSPLLFFNKTLGDIFSSIANSYEKIFTYDQGYIELNKDNEADERFGIWIYMNEDALLTINGLAIESLYYNLNKGWNLINYPALENHNVSYMFGNVSDDINLILTYENNTWYSYNLNKPFNSLTIIRPGIGIWVNIKNNTTWIFDKGFKK